MAYERYRYVYKNRKIVIALLLLISISLAYGVYTSAQTNTIPANEVSTSETETGITGGGTAVIAANKTDEPEWWYWNPAVAANISTNKKYGIPEWWYWSKEDFEKMQWYANQTEIVIRYDWSLVGTNEPVGEIIVAGEPLYKGYAYEGCPNCFLSENISPVTYLEGERKGHCHTVPAVYFYLRKAEGENVKFVGADNIDYSPGVGGYHYWTEWTDSEDKEWVGNFGFVMPKEYWYQKYNWTVDWAQFDEPPAIVHGQINRWTTKNGERVTVISG